MTAKATESTASTRPSLGERALAAGFRRGPNNEGIPETAPDTRAYLEAITRAKGIPDEDNPFVRQTEETHPLWAHIKERLSLDDSGLDDIFNEITDLGIETIDQFDDAYIGCWDSWDAEARFSEDMADSLGLLNDDHFFSFAIDWQRVWDQSLSYDYHCIAGVYFFNSNF